MPRSMRSWNCSAPTSMLAKTPATALSPWQHALGDEFRLLHPRLRTYFGAIPEGATGRGDGVFEIVGTPRRWLWPLLSFLAVDNVLFPAWDRDLPFRVRNAALNGRVVGLRRFEFPVRPHTMTDSIGWESGELVDRLGRHGSVRVGLRATVVDSGLVLESTWVRIAGVRLPHGIAPRVRLEESFDSDARRQRISFVMDHPALGRLYEYSGHFDYRITGQPRGGSHD